ncbi:hypothetical protein B0A52_04536 [Exophiala mesophila]|uniref:CFEM domain-containing protein n=1 Tax=Exophiala mesophila TaxID=212818 RepID=A0A438N9M8_EXOME|nr:hypothetical protein B0A52_04536 [Exophiala mesophila]
MHLSLVLSTTLLAALVSAQGTLELPTCAISCISDSLPADCGGAPACICGRASFIEGISCCIFTSCDEADSEKALNYAHGICDPTGEGGLLPAQAGCADNSTTNGTDTTSTTSITSSGTESSATTATSGTESAASTTSGSGATTTSASESGSASPAASPTDAAAVVGVHVGIGAAAALAVGVAALL